MIKGYDEQQDAVTMTPPGDSIRTSVGDKRGVNMERDQADGVICFGGEDWWYHNRGHIDMQLMRRFAKDRTTIYVNSIVMQKPRLGRGHSFLKKLVRKSKSIFTGLKRADAGFWVYSPFSMPVHHIRWLRPLNGKILKGQMGLVGHKLGIHNPIVWVVCPAACDVAVTMKRSRLVYQRTDRFEEFPDVDGNVIMAYDKTLKRMADLTVFVNTVIYEQERHECRRALYLDHGVDFELFASARDDTTVPDEMRGIRHPIVGFHGAFGVHTTDIPFIEKLVDVLPEMSFVFVGPTVPECRPLYDKKNVWMLGQKAYEQIPHYGKCFDVAIMPWRQNRWIEACNPIKLKEYLALGKPVVSTPFPELQKYADVVYKAAEVEEFAECIRKALSEDSPERIARRMDKVRAASWDSKARLVLDELFAETTS